MLRLVLSQGCGAEENAECTTEPTDEELSCTFSETVDGLGLVIAVRETGPGVDILAFEPLSCGVLGPAAHEGDQLVPGVVIVRVGGEPATTTLLNATGPLVLEFHRPRAAKTASTKGGRPRKLKAKHKRAAPAGVGGAPLLRRSHNMRGRARCREKARRLPRRRRRSERASHTR